MDPWGISKQLHEVGLLGMNGRNGDYISQVNARKFYPLVDDKLLTKELANSRAWRRRARATFSHSVEIRRARIPWQIRKLRGQAGQRQPRHGIRSSRPYRRQPAARQSPHDDLVRSAFPHAEHAQWHLQPGWPGRPRHRRICVEFDCVFDSITHLGVPDIRLIAYKGVPVMGMLRLPTTESEGKANLHQGAIGAGIDLAPGARSPRCAQQRRQAASRHARRRYRRAIPGFDRMLDIAAG